MIEVASIPQKRDKTMIAVELGIYCTLVLLSLLPDPNMISLTVSIAVMTFYCFRSTICSLFTGVKSYFIGVIVFDILFSINSISTFRGNVYFKDINTLTLFMGSVIILAYCILLNQIKKSRMNYWEALNKKTANN
jgi:hypothetical protein